MEDSFDPQAMMQRAGTLARVIRESEAYPALIGGVAGGIAGALMAVIIAGRMTSSRRGAIEESLNLKAEGRGGWSLREAVQLATVVATLAKQAQAWYQEQKRSA